jgi:hypothetical protein
MVRFFASLASSQVIKLPILPGSKSFLESRDWPVSPGHPFTHIETEKLLSPSNTSSVPPVDTVAKEPLERFSDCPLIEAASVEKGLLPKIGIASFYG